MKKTLIVVESPGKVKTIQKYVGDKYLVKASVGHIKDLPSGELGIDVENDFKLKFVINEDKKKVVADLKKSAKNSDTIYLATDPDREGECIAQHLADELNVSGNCRITFNEITKSAILAALKKPREINANKVSAQTTRRVLDRLVGYTLSPLLWKKVAPKTSAGRVQSAALLMIANKEREIRRFKSRDYWTIDTSVKAGDAIIKANLVDDEGKTIEFVAEADALHALAEIKESAISIEGIETTQHKRSPYPPFTTSTLQQGCAATLHMSAHITMMKAQKLYEGVSIPGHGDVALITYMRTDSTRSSPEAINDARNVISKKFASNYLPANKRWYEQKKKHAQDAHEAIRPTDLSIDPSSVSDTDFRRVYDLIWRRFIASQMEDARLEQTKLKFKTGKYNLEAKGTRIVFDGFLAVYPIQIEEQSMPKISDKIPLTLESAENVKHSTQPARRYSEAQLIKTLEKQGIGRPSTYASIIKNIVERGYVSKDKGSFHLTEMGLLVNDMLQHSFASIINLEFTSKMEDNLDLVEEGTPWKDIVSEFYTTLQTDLQKAKKEPKREITTSTKCPDCQNSMTIKFGKNGRFMACGAYPKCKKTMEIAFDLDLLSFIDAYLISPIDVPQSLAPVIECPKCSGTMKQKQSRFGAFWGCSGYPECKYTKSILKPIAPCVICETGNIVEKGKDKKKFFACDGYPECKRIYPSKPTSEKCESCSDYLIIYKKKTICTNKECDKFVNIRFTKKKQEPWKNGRK